jgi:hypothetical protein
MPRLPTESRLATSVLEPSLERLQPLIPPALHLGQPCGCTAEAGGHDPVENLAALALADEQARRGQGRQVLDDSCCAGRSRLSG